MNKQAGFSIAEMGIVCMVVLIVGVLGYVFYDKWIDGTTQTETAQTSSAEDSAAPAIASTEDLSNAETLLDGTDLGDDSSLSALDAELESF
jgi:hypothetical protein